MIREHWFDMDHTLIDNDCDVSWKLFLTAKGLAPADAPEIAERFYQDYLAGTLDNAAFTRFQLAEFQGRTPEQMRALAEEHFQTVVKPCIYPGAFLLIQELKEAGLPVAILTSTNTVIAAPVARYFQINRLLGTELELIDGHYTGCYAGTYAVGPGKVVLAQADVAARGVALTEIAYYGDSINDRFILEQAGAPCAVNPDAALRALAESNRWPILNFRD